MKSVKSKKVWNLNKRKILLIVFLFVTVSFLILKNFFCFLPSNFFIWIQTKFHDFSRGESFSYSEDDSGLISKSQGFIDNNVVFLKDSGFFVINKHCRRIFSDKFGFESPKIKTAGLRSIVYDAKKTGFNIYTSYNKLFSGSSDNPIISAAISGSGAYGFLTMSKTHFSEMAIFGADNRKIYSYFFADRFVSDMAISNLGNYSAVCGYKIVDSAIESAVYVLNHKSEQPKKVLNFPDEMIFKVEYFPNGNLIFFSEQAVRALTGWFGTLKEYFFEDKFLNCFDTVTKENIMLCFSDGSDGNNCEIVCLNSNLNEVSSIKTNLRITDVTQKNEVICALCGQEVYCYNVSGKLIKTLKISAGAEKISLVTNSKLAVLGNQKVVIFDL